MKTTSHELDQKSKQYILDCIYCDDRELKTNDEKIDYIKNRFYNEVRPSQRQSIQIVPEIEKWLRGIAIDIEYDNYKILQLAISWGSLSEHATERQEDAIMENYWHFMANKINQLFTGYRIPKEVKI